ncbi:MAG: hypothetical protein LN573_03480 [Rickettsia endosymbiont of Oxypoda opaca]|nr:hypothetical protein [Rickettsia endosymbiont of Oxypoda opaca]
MTKSTMEFIIFWIATLLSVARKALLRGSILPYYGYYKYGVIPWLDHGIQKKP